MIEKVCSEFEDVVVVINANNAMELGWVNDYEQIGASETISFEIAKEDMASYDSNQIKTENGGYILEAGEYGVSIRSDAHTVLAEETFTVDEDISYGENKRESDNITAVNQFQDYSRGNVTYLSREDGFANYEEATAAPSEGGHVRDG